MPFVKLDCTILNSTLWFERDVREIFITALLMAEPKEITEPQPEIATRSLSETGWIRAPRMVRVRSCRWRRNLPTRLRRSGVWDGGP